MIEIDLHTSYDNSKFDENVLYDDHPCNNDCAQSILFVTELKKSAKT